MEYFSIFQIRNSNLINFLDSKGGMVSVALVIQWHLIGLLGQAWNNLAIIMWNKNKGIDWLKINKEKEHTRLVAKLIEISVFFFK